MNKCNYSQPCFHVNKSNNNNNNFALNFEKKNIALAERKIYKGETITFIEEGANRLHVRMCVAASHLQRRELCASVLGVHVRSRVHQHTHGTSQILLRADMQRRGT